MTTPDVRRSDSGPRAEWPGRWKFYGVKDAGVSYFQGVDSPPEDAWVVPVGDEAQARAVAELYLYAQAEWGWGSDEYESVVQAVHAVIRGLKG